MLVVNVRARRAQALAYLGNKCARCDTKVELEFAHIDPTSKLFDITATNLRRPARELILELNKCLLLCPIHRRSPQRWKHGTQYAWETMKCRCLVCTPAWRQWNEQRNARRRKEFGRGRYEREPLCGTRRKYVRGCRCSECRRANAQYTKELRERRCTVVSV